MLLVFAETMQSLTGRAGSALVNAEKIP